MSKSKYQKKLEEIAKNCEIFSIEDVAFGDKNSTSTPHGMELPREDIEARERLKSEIREELIKELKESLSIKLSDEYGDYYSNSVTIEASIHLDGEEISRDSVYLRR